MVHSYSARALREVPSVTAIHRHATSTPSGNRQLSWQSWHRFLLQTHSFLKCSMQFIYECCGVLHKQELWEEKCTGSEGQEKNKKKAWQKLEVVTSTQRQGYHSVIQCCPCWHTLQGYNSRKKCFAMFFPLLPGPLIRSALISDTLLQHPNHPPGVSKAGWIFPTQGKLSAVALPSVCYG